MDPPIPTSVFYEAYQDTKIKGVPIDKGTIMRFEITSPSYDTNDWLDPWTFEPERHNTESDFYKKSVEQGKIQNVYSRRPFSHGPRNCPGMTFALLELRIMVAYFITHVDYTVPKDLLENDGMGFPLGLHIIPKFEIK